MLTNQALSTRAQVYLRVLAADNRYGRSLDGTCFRISSSSLESRVVCSGRSAAGLTRRAAARIATASALIRWLPFSRLAMDVRCKPNS